MAKAGEIKSPYRGDDIDRRSFLKIGAGGVVAAGAFTTGALAFFDAENREKESEKEALIRDYRVAEDESLPQVVQVHGTDEVQVLDKAIESLGGIRRFIEPGDKVAIKPNIGWDRVPKHAANTNPTLVAAMVTLCFQAGADEVVVTDASCNDANRAFKKSGIGQAAYNAGARVLLPRKDRFRDMVLKGKLLDKWPVYTPLVFADKVINMAICKHHNLTDGLTAGMKNWYGILGGQRNLLHQDIHQSIYDLTNFMRPTLTVLDAMRVLVRNGPQGGSFSDTEMRNVVVAGTDQVAIDAIAADILGRDPLSVGFLKLSDGKLGHVDLSKVRYRKFA